MASEKQYISVKYFAEALNATERAVRRWCASGDLKAFQPPCGRGWRIERTEIERMKLGLPLTRPAA